MESLERKMDLLRTIGPFAQIPTALLRPVAQEAEVVRLGAGDVIIRQGDPGDSVYALIDGIAEAWLEDPSSDPCSCARCGPASCSGRPRFCITARGAPRSKRGPSS